ncbi:MAG TPA: diguanylate cyclase [Methylomirabilota bacterium]|nr:diguanylate cyclase [Methylomirabilota bacterium]
MSGEKLRVLLAEGESGRAEAALRAFYPDEQGQLELTVVSVLATLLAALEKMKPELILLDLAIAPGDSVEAVRVVHRAAPEVPLIVLTDETNRRTAAEALSRGAVDCLHTEQLDEESVTRALRVALEQNTLEGLANLLRDPVTGLYTGDGFQTLGMRAMESAKRKESTLVLLCARIENLPTIRAEFGPSAAESSLHEMGAVLAGSFRRTDVIARLGDSQFAVLAIDAVEPSAPVLCQRLERRIAVLNREIGPWGPLEVRLSAQFWSAASVISFCELLDNVEAGLRAGPKPAGARSAERETASRR